MFRKMRFWLPAVSVVVLLVIAGCRAAEPTAVPTTAPAVATTAPAAVATTAPGAVATTAPAAVATTAPAAVATTAPVMMKELTPSQHEPASVLAWVPKVLTDIIDDFPGRMRWYGDLPLPTTQPKYGGRIVRSGSYGYGGGITHWDVSKSTQATGAGATMCFGRILTFHQDRFSKRQSIIPENDAADSWKQVDSVTWEFNLNPEVYWHDTAPADGRRVTAEDIKWNIEYLRDKSIYAGSFDLINDVEIVDPATIRIHLDGPYAYLLELLASAGHSFLLPELEDVPGGWANWCIGFGPFKLVEYEPSGPWSLDSHPKYHHFGHTGMRIPYVDGVDIVNLSDTAAGYAAMTTGRIHLMTYSAIGDLRRALQANPNIEGQFMPMSPGAQYHFAWNLTKAPFDDVRVRRAISMCIDRQAIIDTVYEGSAQTSGQIPFDAVGWNTFPPNNLRGKYLQYNPTAAKKLLAEAGYPNGFETEVDMSPTGPANMMQVETAVFQMNKSCGIDAKINLMQYVERQQRLIERTYPAMSYGFYTPSTNWDSYTYGYMNSKSATNNFMINDPGVDKITEAARLTTDKAEQIRLYKELWDLEEENLYRLNLTTPYFYTTYHNFLDNVASGTYTWITSWYSMGKSRIWFKP